MLYKYRNIDARTFEILKTQKIWLATASTLNDPLECRPPVFSNHEIYNHLSKTWGYQLMGFLHQIMHCKETGEDFFGIYGRDLDKLARKIKKKDDIQKKIKVANNFMLSVGAQGFSDPSFKINSLQKHLKNTGVFSLSEDPLNTLLWSHYSGEHTGVALGFETTSESKLSNQKFCSKVEYVKTLPKYSLDDFSRMQLTIFAGNRRPEHKILFDDPFIRRILTTKTTEWSYEKEWRYFEKESGSHEFPGKLSEIIFGVNTPEENIKEMIRVCKDHIPNNVSFKRCFYGQNSSVLQMKKIKG